MIMFFKQKTPPMTASDFLNPNAKVKGKFPMQYTQKSATEPLQKPMQDHKQKHTQASIHQLNIPGILCLVSTIDTTVRTLQTRPLLYIALRPFHSFIQEHGVFFL